MKWNNLILAGLLVQALASPAAAQDLYRSIELGPNLTIQTYPNLLNEDLLLRPKFLPIGRMPDLMTPPDRVRSATARDYTPPAQILPYAFCVGRAAMLGPAKADFRFCNVTGQELTFILSIGRRPSHSPYLPAARSRSARPATPRRRDVSIKQAELLHYRQARPTPLKNKAERMCSRRNESGRADAHSHRANTG